ncbi:hypothetical protein GGI05_002773 [Coemansia sp. RSA 2603]|nr:hypothetical protein GGI05_002773 [Coemansia sp. RSA 2603]
MKVSVASLTLLVTVGSLFVVSSTAKSAAGEDDEAIGDFLGVRPDLADDLNPADNKPETEEKSEVQGSRAQKEAIDCVQACSLTDQSCRARCMGVPGVASRKMPRKQDINGNLPLNWKINKDEVVKPASPHGSENVGTGKGHASVSELAGVIGMAIALGFM